MSQIKESALELIGKTPMMKLNGYTQNIHIRRSADRQNAPAGAGPYREGRGPSSPDSCKAGVSESGRFRERPYCTGYD